MKKGKIKALLVLLVIVLAGIYYYVTIPAINIHSTGIWIFILFVLVLILAAYAAKKKFTSIREVKSSKFLKIGGIVLMAVLLVFAAGSILSSPIVNAKQYRNLLTIEERDFSEDIQPVNFSQIPLLDKDSAMILGNRKMGSMVDMVSQFEVSDLYSQINYQEKPVTGNPGVYYDRYDDTGYLAGKTGQTDPLFRGRISEPEYLSPSAFSLSNLYLRSVKFRD